MEESTESRESLRLSLRGLALSSVLVALASLATLVVVVSLKDIDALSTLALALAVLAFVVQLIVFIVQAADTSRQSAQSRALHTQMMLALAEIQERTQGTQHSVNQMNSQLLEALIGKATNEGLNAGSPEFARRVASGLTVSDQPRPQQSDAPAPSRRPARRTTYNDWPGPMNDDEAAALHGEMRKWPTPAEQDEVTKILESLSDDELEQFSGLAADLLRNTEPDSVMGPGLTVFEGNTLHDKGLVEKVPGWKLYTLSPKGRLAGRVFTAAGEPSPEVAGLRTFRDKAQRLEEEARQASLRSRRD